MTDNQVIWLVIMYCSVGFVVLGLLLGSRRAHKQQPRSSDLFGAIFWPVAILLAIGFAIGSSE